MEKKRFWEKLFPAKYDFHGMLTEQARVTAQGIKALLDWFENMEDGDYKAIFKIAEEADRVRMDMEDKLIQSFYTPFDRQDIYSISVEMNRIIDYAKFAVEAMDAFDVAPDKAIISMTKTLHDGISELSEALSLLKNNPHESQRRIERMRKDQHMIECFYREGMLLLFANPDIIYDMKHREVYRHMKDAAMYLGYTVDIFHKIVVRVI